MNERLFITISNLNGEVRWAGEVAASDVEFDDALHRPQRVRVTLPTDALAATAIERKDDEPVQT